MTGSLDQGVNIFPGCFPPKYNLRRFQSKKPNRGLAITFIKAGAYAFPPLIWLHIPCLKHQNRRNRYRIADSTGRPWRIYFPCTRKHLFGQCDLFSLRVELRIYRAENQAGRWIKAPVFLRRGISSDDKDPIGTVEDFGQTGMDRL